MTTQQETILAAILDQLDKLPEIPTVALQVSTMLDDPDTDAQALSEVIMMDPVLTAQILRICNSAEYGFSRKIGTISEAVSILGYKVLKRVIYTIISHGFLNRPVPGYALDKGDLWENAVTCGEYARTLAQKINYPDPEQVFVAALLRDIGKIAMSTFLEGKHPQVEEAAKETKTGYADAEESVLGVSHTSVGARIASHWKLPPALAYAIEYHHKPSSLPDTVTPQDKTLVALTHLADAYTMMTGTGVGVDGLMYPLDPAVLSVLNLSSEKDTLEQWYTELLALQQKIQTMSQALLAN